MRGFKMRNLALTNQTTGEYQLISMQVTYSTADIEKFIFYGERKPIDIDQPLGEAKIMVIHGDVFSLEEGPTPQPFTPLTEQSGLFKIIKLVEQPAP
jgi:hypothetical protein